MLNNTPKSAVKSLNNDNFDINASIHDVKFLVDRYMTRSFTLGITAPAGIALLRECYERAAGDFANQKVIEALSFAQFNKDILSEDELTFLSRNRGARHSCADPPHTSPLSHALCHPQ